MGIKKKKSWGGQERGGTPLSGHRSRDAQQQLSGTRNKEGHWNGRLEEPRLRWASQMLLLFLPKRGGRSPDFVEESGSGRAEGGG